MTKEYTMKKKKIIEHCHINIKDKEGPIFILENLGNNTHVYFTVMNTITLPVSANLQFNKNELDLLKNQDVFFIQGVEKPELLERLLIQIKPYCRTSKIINLFDFISLNNFDFNGSSIDIFDLLRASKLDEVSFKNLLIYFCNFDSYDLQFTLESYGQAEVEVEEIYNVLHYHSRGFKNEKDA